MAIQRGGFIGLGIMGAPMAANLLKAGFEVTVWNRTRGRAVSLLAAGASLASSPREVAEVSQVTLSCVTNSPDVEAITLGPNGVIEGAVAGSVSIDCSTISPEVARRELRTTSCRILATAGATEGGSGSVRSD